MESEMWCGAEKCEIVKIPVSELWKLEKNVYVLNLRESSGMLLPLLVFLIIECQLISSEKKKCERERFELELLVL